MPDDRFAARTSAQIFFQAALTVYGGKNLNFTNTISGDGSLIIRGGGTTNLAGTNEAAPSEAAVARLQLSL